MADETTERLRALRDFDRWLVDGLTLKSHTALKRLDPDLARRPILSLPACLDFRPGLRRFSRLCLRFFELRKFRS